MKKYKRKMQAVAALLMIGIIVGCTNSGGGDFPIPNPTPETPIITPSPEQPPTVEQTPEPTPEITPEPEPEPEIEDDFVPIDENHPIFGTWRFQAWNKIEFRDDGTLFIGHEHWGVDPINRVISGPVFENIRIEDNIVKGTQVGGYMEDYFAEHKRDEVRELFSFEMIDNNTMQVVIIFLDTDEMTYTRAEN